MGLLTFVVAAISVRFVYPAFQLEGRPFWFFLSAPVSLREVYLKKLALFVPPILILALVLNYLSNLYMAPPPFLFYLSFLYIILVSLVSPLVALFLGTKNIDFRESPNPYGGMGGITAMLVMLTYAGVTLGLLAWTSSSLLFFVQRKIVPPFGVQARVAAACLAVLGGSLFMMRLLFRRTQRNLDSMEL
jgi:ABC-2 type transport system permease protein